VLRHLWDYRDGQAKRMNRPVYKVIPNQVLLQLAAERPESMADLERLFRGKQAMKKRHGKALVQAVLDGLDDDRPVPKPEKKRAPKRKGPRSRLQGRQADRAFAELKEWRQRTLKADDSLTPYMTASNGVLKAIASRRPYDLDELAAIPDVREWQVEDWGDELLDVLDDVDPNEE
jgi:ribonuclease D